MEYGMNEQDLQRLDSIGQETEAWANQEAEREGEAGERAEAEQAAQTQALAEQDDPRNKENWGAGGVIKELQSAFAGGIQDTASSAVTLPERILDTMTGEIQEEQKEGKYDTEWDDWFVDDDNPIETKTWWGGLIRSATHFGTMGAAIVAAAPAAGAAGTALGAGRVVTAVGGLVANQWARAAAVGAATDLVSKYSQDANALQVLRDQYGFIDTPLTTNDLDHPVLKTFKNVVEGMGIGELANGVFRIIGKGARKVYPDGSAIDATQEGIAKGAARQASVDEQTIAKGQLELFETPNEIRGHKNKPLVSSDQGAPTSRENPVDVKDAQTKIRKEWGAEEGSPGSVTTPIGLERAVKTSGLSEEVVDEIYKGLVSEPRYNATLQAVREARMTLKEVAGDSMEQFQRTGLGREAADVSPEEYLAEYFEGAHRYFEDTPDEMLAWTSKNVVAGDLLIGSLIREIRDMGLVGRELADITDLASVDGVAKATYDKLITAVTEVKRSRLLQSNEFRALGAKFDDPREITRAKIDQQGFIKENIEAQVGESIEGFRLAFKIAGESKNDDLFKAVLETISMNKEIHNLNDFDAWVRRKLKGGEFNGKTKTGVLIKELQGVMVNSILSGPKTPARAIIGTSTATFLRPLSTTVGAALRYPFTGDGTTVRASLAAANAMRESIPEAWTLFKTRLNSYWAGDISTIKSRYSEYTRGDEQWAVFGDWVENSGRATDGDKAAYYAANMARQLNDNNFLNYSTKIMAATDDTFGYILSRAKGREKAFREAMDSANKGQYTEITPQVLKDGENRFLQQITDADGNILDDAVEFAKREATLTTDLTGFSKGLNKVFESAPWAKPFFLFARTGVNGLALTAKHTPGFNFLVKEWNDINFARPDDLSSVAKYGINSAEELANAKALQTGRLAIGSSVITMAGMHFMNGGLTGNGPTDRQKRQVWLDAGYIPRSINIGGVWVGYDSFEPFNQILSGVADIGDHSELMGEEWTKDQFQKYALVLAQSAASKSYLQGVQQFVDLFAGRPGQQNRIIAGLMNNTIPLAGLRNDLGKLFSPHTKELGSSIGDSIRNRNQLTENLTGDPLPIKYDMLNGTPVKEYDFMTRMWNMFSPIPLNLDQGPGRKLLFDSGYDLRTSTYYGPDGTDLTESPELRSLFQQFIGKENLEVKLNRLAEDPRIQASIAEMQDDIRSGRRNLDPMKSYHHNKKIQAMFNKARTRAWANMMKVRETQSLIERQKDLERDQRLKLKKTQTYEPLLQMSK
tara:strand:+ start:1081 stop:4866 length:3786 start_codon:yes stop_codon:yes gene_type:complete